MSRRVPKTASTAARSSGNRWRYSSGPGVLAGDLAELALDPQELLEQKGATRPGLRGQEVLDAGPVAALIPVALEAIGRLVDPGPLASLGCGSFRSPRSIPKQPDAPVRTAASATGLKILSDLSVWRCCILGPPSAKICLTS